MANSASIRSGISALMQDHLSTRIVDNTTDIMPVLAVLMGKDGNKAPGQSFGLGRPRSGQVFTGVPMAKPNREEILATDKYMPAVVTGVPDASDGKVMNPFDTVPVVADWENNSPASNVTRPFFKWVDVADPILVPKYEIEKTMKGGQSPKAREAVGELFKFQSEQVLKTHLTRWNDYLWASASTGVPANVDSAKWSRPYSFAAALKGDNVYAGVDRGIAANSFWAGNYVSTTTAANVIDLIDYANYTGPGIAKKGRGVTLLVVGLTLWPIFKAQARAHQALVQNSFPELGNIGFKREVVRYGETYIICDPRCPSVARGDSTNFVLGLDLETWTVAFSPNKNFSVAPIFDLSQTEGGKDAIKSTLRTEAIIACEAPSRNIIWIDVA